MSNQPKTKMGAFESAAHKFIDASPWLTDEHAPGLMTMLVAAGRLDEGMSITMLNQYNLAYRDLLKRAPGGPKMPDDPLEAMLS